MNQQARAILLGGVLPVVLFTVIEEYYGTVAGLIAGMVFGVGEILYEWRKEGRVQGMTWIGNGMLLVLGGVSLFTREGVWFKLQPAIIEGVMGFLLIGSVLGNQPMLLAMAEKQGTLSQMRPEVRPVFSSALRGMTLRMALFFLAHAGLATWAALYWSTRAWAILKGVGFTLSMIAYVVLESLVLRRRIRSLSSSVVAET